MSAPSLSRRLATAAGQASAEEVVADDQRNRAPAKARVGKTMIAGYFSPDMARAIKMLAAERGVTVQWLIGEGLDAVLRVHGKHPMEER